MAGTAADFGRFGRTDFVDTIADADQVDPSLTWFERKRRPVRVNETDRTKTRRRAFGAFADRRPADVITDAVSENDRGAALDVVQNRLKSVAARLAVMKQKNDILRGYLAPG